MAERKMLEAAGYRAETARTGEQAVELALELEPDLILMDVDLGPGIRGTEAARRILQQRNLAILFLSSHSEPEFITSAESITSYGYVLKSTGREILLASIRMAFRLADANARALAERDRASALLTHLPLPLVQVDRDFRIVYANGPAIRFARLSSQLAAPLHLRDFTGCESDRGGQGGLCAIHAAVLNVFASGRRTGPNTATEDDGGESRVVRFFVTESSDEDTVLVTFEDVTGEPDRGPHRSTHDS